MTALRLMALMYLLWGALVVLVVYVMFYAGSGQSDTPVDQI